MIECVRGGRGTVGSNLVIQRWSDVQHRFVRESNLKLTKLGSVKGRVVLRSYMEKKRAPETTVTCSYIRRTILINWALLEGSAYISCFESHSLSRRGTVCRGWMACYAWMVWF